MFSSFSPAVLCLIPWWWWYEWQMYFSNFIGEWLGVEWDETARGKNNGTYKGKTYFTTSHQDSGSFIRKANLDQILDRYG